MKNSFIALSCALIAQNGFALEFTTEKTPYQTLEAEYNSASSASLRDFARMEDRATWSKSQLICTYEVKPDTALADVQSRPKGPDTSGFTLVEFNQVIQKGTPPQGPLFPGTPDLVAARYNIMTCGSKVITSNLKNGEISCEDLVRYLRNPDSLLREQLDEDQLKNWTEYFEDIRKNSMDIVPNGTALTLKNASSGYTLNVRKTNQGLIVFQVLRSATETKPAQTNYSYCWKETL